MSLSSDAIANSQRLIHKYGQLLTFTRQSIPAFNIADGTVAVADITVYSVYAVTKTATFIDLIKSLTQHVMTDIIISSADNYLPLIGDKVNINGQDYRVMVIKAGDINGIDVVYTLSISL